MRYDQDKNLILVVDDTPTNLSVISQALHNAGFTVAVETDGESAIEQVNYNQPDLILLDVMMPGIDGFETCKRLKANPSNRDIPVIFMTALTDTVDKVKGLSIGAVDYITKPFQQDEVLARVRIHLQLRHLTRTLDEQNARLKQEVAERAAAETRLSKTFQQLKEAQEQIIATEKLAYLGTLTAGVAHELRNPLNFVNNYAEGSMELAEELIEEFKIQLEHIETTTASYIKDTLTELRDNSLAIKRHGQRAEGIIQSMMQHARTDSTQLQLTDLNAVLAQAIQLAYHSVRAKNHHFNVTIKTDYNDSIGQLELVSSDISRAFINIIENACYALQSKQKNIGEPFTPMLWVKTLRLSDSVEIRIGDNGTGIPPEIKEKIFHPFFTTKPTGEGTGLGLSLTYDIIIGQHRGTLNVETELGAYTEFIICLPFTNLGSSN
ncbi:response regulator [Moorena producens JHB]|uniref:histidine kinase n=1 Tax=Moorena producens (strain JHB) TaxID=1454205 RepID=A0A1D9G917_MOOP1|nr:response regulator [Moorena producens]AOY84166.1 response regulator [Moorena producens JHB]